MSLARRLLAAGALLGLGTSAVLLAGHDVIPRLFTSDPAVLHQAAVLWPWFVAMIPLNGVLSPSTACSSAPGTSASCAT